MDERLTTLEETLAHQHRDIEAMSHEMYRQQREIVQLRREIAALHKKLSALTDAPDSIIRRIEDETPPPHY